MKTPANSSLPPETPTAGPVAGGGRAVRPRGSSGAVALLVARESLRSFFRNRNLETAATLAYYGFLSLMPLLLLSIYALGLVVASSSAALDALRGLLADLLPSFDDQLVGELVALSGRRSWGVASLALLLWSMTPCAGAARHALVDIFKGAHRPAFVREKITDLAVVLAMLVLFLLLTAGRLAGGALGLELPAALRIVRALVPAAATAGVVGFFYKTFAPVSLRWRDALAGSAVAALLLGLMRPLFDLLLRFNPDYGYAFGSLKAIFLLIVWVYYTFAVLLFGAELSANAHRREALVLRAFLAGDRAAAPIRVRLLDRFIRRPEEGAVLFREGEPGREMYVVRSGAVRLTRAGVVLRDMCAGEYFGEMSLLLGAARAATATCCAPGTELVAITAQNVDLILGENPAVVRRLLRDMAARLQAMNERLVS